jgi:thiamine-monophosphate kinase
MPLSEFDLIRKYFRSPSGSAPGVRCGIGDDAALVAIPAGMDLALSMDTLVAGVHFQRDATAADIGYKSLAVNLSDMAAMGARPGWALLSLTLPEPDENWLGQFMLGFNELAEKYSVSLIGGDLSRGPLSITIEIHGLLPEGKGLRRSGASADDLIYVSGTLGDGGLALKILAGQETVSGNGRSYLLSRLHRPSPRVELGMALLPIATSAIDISDGLVADLGHVLEASGVGARLDPEKLPLSEPVQQLGSERAWGIAATSGDDYELCFTVSPDRRIALEKKCKQECPVTCIGSITAQPGMQWVRTDGSVFQPEGSGYRHF